MESKEEWLALSIYGMFVPNFFLDNERLSGLVPIYTFHSLAPFDLNVSK